MDVTLDAGPRGRTAVLGGLAATAVNVALWVGGRAADVSFRVRSSGGEPGMRVGLGSVVLTTVVLFAVGAAVLVLAGRRWAGVVTVAAGAVAVLSAVAPPLVADDTATGLLLAAMHLATGAAFVATAVAIRGGPGARPRP